MLPILSGTAISVTKGWPTSYATANWSSAGIAPDPFQTREAIVQVYAARTGRWKGIFADHTWIAVKRSGARRFARYEVVGWGRPVRKNAYDVDGRWYSNPPRVVHEIRGKRAARLIPQIERAVRTYPAQRRGSYRVWPGPNSNTFVAHVARSVAGLQLEMPPTAVGKDFMGPGFQIGRTPSQTGWQFSYGGLIGGAIGWREGIEIHLLGATIGIDPDDLAIKLPALGKLGLI